MTCCRRLGERILLHLARGRVMPIVGRPTLSLVVREPGRWTMRVSTVTAFGAALALAAAMSVVPLQVAGAQSPSTSVLVPSSGATLSGSTYLDASASNATSVEFGLFGGSYGLSGHLIGTATPTIYGWLDSWNTTTVPNDSYVLVSYASGPGGSTASGVSITVNNPSTTVIIPASGATLDDAQGYVLDAVASPGATSVTFLGTARPRSPPLPPSTVGYTSCPRIHPVLCAFPSRSRGRQSRAWPPTPAG